ncbi:MAG: transporter, partial [Gemmatimonadales bacterium]|nr:transporter [Gemmatimonadales bacterium]
AGGIGLEVRLPISYVLAPRWVLHVNAGATLVPRAHGPGEGAVTGGSVEGGASLIWLAFPTLNLMLESVWARERTAVAAGLARTADSWFISPGARYAINAPGDLQIVPGIAYLIGLGPSGGEGSLFLYLSFEHAFRRR